MTRKLVAFLTALLLVFGLTFAAPALALHAIQDEGGGTVSLDRTGEGDNVPEQASGVATFRVSSSSEGFYHLKVKITTDALPEKSGRIYEAWLADSDTDTALNLGAFDTDNEGEGELEVTRTINNLADFDRVIVSREAVNDPDPRVNGPIVLEGEQR